MMAANFQEINTAMQEYFLAQYRYGRAAYDTDTNNIAFSHSAGRRVLSEADQNAMEARLRELLTPADQAWFASPAAVIEHLRDAARNAGKDDVRGDVSPEEGMRRAQQAYLSESRTAIALIDDNNIRGRGGRETSHQVQLVQARGNRMVPASQTTTPAAAPAQDQTSAPAQGAVMHGTNATRYGQSVSISPDQARNTARVAILSAGFGTNNNQHFNGEKVSELLAQIPVAERYSNAHLRQIADQQREFSEAAQSLRNEARPPLSSENIARLTAEATDAQRTANAMTAVIGILTLENKFADERAAGRTSFRMFANNAEVVSHYQDALNRARGYSLEDTSVAPSANAGDIPPAPGGPDNEPAGPYRGQEYPASNTPRGTVREAQLLFEALGPEYSTGRGNTRRFGAGQRDAAAMDGIVGEMTDAAIRKFQGENNLEVTGALDEATMTKLREVVAARAAATGQGQATDGTGTGTPTDLRTQLAPQLAAVANLSDAPLSRADLMSQYAQLQQALTNSGLSQEKITEFNNAGSLATLTNGFLGSIEQALGLTVDSKADARLIALLTDPTAGPAIANAINAGSITAVASATGAGSPTVPGNNSGQGQGIG